MTVWHSINGEAADQETVAVLEYLASSQRGGQPNPTPLHLIRHGTGLSDHQIEPALQWLLDRGIVRMWTVEGGRGEEWVFTPPERGEVVIQVDQCRDRIERAAVTSVKPVTRTRRQPLEKPDYFTHPQSIIKQVQVGSQQHSWSDEMAHLWSPEMRVRTLQVMDEIVAEGEVIEPVLIGSDGRMWDGHHRMVIAVALGLPLIPVCDMRSKDDGSGPAGGGS